MTKTRELFQRVKILFSEEQYRRALEEVERAGAKLCAETEPSSEHRDLLLLIANVYCVNRKYRETRWCLSCLEARYPGIDERFEYTVLRLRLYLKEGSIWQARHVLDASRSRIAQSDCRTVLDFFDGALHFRTRKYIDANRFFHGCYRHFSTSPDPIYLGDTLYMLGLVAFRKMLFDTAERYFANAIKLFDLAGRCTMLGLGHRMAGVTATRQGRYDDAHEHLRRAMACFKRCSDRNGIIDVQLARARVLICGDRSNEAERLLRGLVRATGKIGYAGGAARAWMLLGDVLQRLERPTEALSCLGEAERFAILSGSNDSLIADISRVRGEALLAVERIDEAETFLEQSFDRARGTGDRRAVGALLRALGRCAVRKKDIDRARVCFDESILHLSGAGDTYELLSAYLEASEVYAVWGHDGALPERYRVELLAVARGYITRASALCPLHGARTIARCETLTRHIEAASVSLAPGAGFGTVQFDSSSLHYGMLVARSAHMREVVEKVRNLAPSTVPILIVGETGTGKEVVARLIHRLSNRSKGAFIAVNCAALPESVFESELFGHKKGSFTGAFRDTVGLIEQASGGTVFLDEISELTNQQQAKLLRALQDGLIRRVGETSERPIDVRVVSASNEDIDILRQSDRLRDDFYYRISVETIELKPLRERREDITPLFEYYLQVFGGEYRVEKGAFKLLRRHHWPGNVRELVGVAKVLALIGKKRGVIHAHDLPVKIFDSAERSHGREKSKRRSKISGSNRLSAAACKSNPDRVRELIVLSLAKYHGNISATARALGVSRCTLYRRMKELKMARS
jgi:DNA-binding NtrC family response regulator/tetratricopeptide (TPR) repeat protein